MSDDRKLSVIQGARASSALFGAVRVCAELDQKPGFEADFEVFEEDTFLVLSAPPIVPERSEHPIRVMTDVLEAKPRSVGEVIRRGQRLLAVIHDLSRTPSCTEADVVRGARAALEEADRWKARSVRMPPLGAVHRVMTEKRSIDLLLQVIEDLSPRSLQRVGIAVSSGALGPLELLLGRR